MRKSYPILFEAISTVLFKNDPMGINFESNTDEYKAEAGTILPRLKHCTSEGDVLTVIYEEFCHWFGSDMAGPKSRYKKTAEEIWKIWKENTSQSRKS